MKLYQPSEVTLWFTKISVLSFFTISLLSIDISGSFLDKRVISSQGLPFLSLITIAPVHAQQTTRDKLVQKNKKLKAFLRKITKTDDIIKKFGRARIVVKYKDKTPKITPPGIGTRAWYQTWKFVGFPAAAPSKLLGKSKFVRKDVTQSELDALRKNPEIDLIITDIPLPPALFQSGPFVRPKLKQFPLANRPKRQSHAAIVLDTGIESDHPFLSDALLNDFAACFSTEQLTPPFTAETLCPNGELVAKGIGAAEPCDPKIVSCDHGTHVAGIISGWNGNFDNKVFHGIAPEVPLIPVQIYSKITAKDVCEAYGFESPCILSFISDQLEALAYAQELNDKGVPIGSVNLSLSFGALVGACDEDETAKPLAQAIQRLSTQNIPVVVAAGNEADLTGVGIPGCVDAAVTVAASDNDGKLALIFPGTDGGSNFSDMADLGAPGLEIISSVPGKGFQKKSGTSMSAPHVAALLAKARSLKPEITVKQLIGIISNLSEKNIEHPLSQLKRPVVKFDGEKFLAALSPTGANLLAGPASAGKTRKFLQTFKKKSNRLIIDYGDDNPEELQQKIFKLLEKMGIKVVKTENKTSKLSVIVTEKPINPEELESLKEESKIKGLYQDVPFPLP